jgi:hypothetical protein
VVKRHQFAELLKKHIEVRFNFVATELDLATTFYERATSATDEDTTNRNTKNAVRAYQSALRTLGNLSLDERPEIAAKLARVAKMLSKTAETAVRHSTDRCDNEPPW